MTAQQSRISSDKFEACLESSLAALVEPDARVLLAVSGGRDSTAMMFASARAASRTGRRFVVGFVDHGLRAAAQEERRLAERQARDLGLEFVARKIDAQEAEKARQAGSLQEWARRRRYQLLADMAHACGCRCVATAHTASDQAETLLMRMLRGSGIDGLGGIMPRRCLEECPDVEVVRPMLFASRDESRDYLVSIGEKWSDDPSNDDDRFTRVRVRREILAAMETLAPGVSARMSALADEARGVVRLLESDRFLESGIIESLRLGSGVRVAKETFDKLPMSLHTRVIRRALRHVRGGLRRLDRRHIDQIAGHLRRGDSTGSLPLPGDGRVFADRGSFYVFPGPLPEKVSGSGHPVAVGPGLWRIRFMALGVAAEVRVSSFAEIEDWEIRARRSGDRLYDSNKKLKQLFQQHRVPVFYRDYVPVLAWEDKVIGCPMMLSSRVCGIGVTWTLDNEAPVLDVGLNVRR